ncbi:MAG: DUF2723 domain-containing protein [Anaerolineae bacterium]|nr:DUF2723 domain-containing protein [Anaerolineae bacterium]
MSEVEPSAFRIPHWVSLLAPHVSNIIAGLLFLLSLALYVRTLAPSVADVFSDTLEFQLVGPTLGIAHETGYPLYTLLSWLFARLLPLGDAATRVNLLSALCAALAVAFVYRAGQLLTGRRLAALCAAVIFALSPVWWSQAVIAEVYALHGLFVALILWLILRWEASRHETRNTDHGLRITHHASRITHHVLRIACCVFGLSLTHHRLTLLLAPALIVFVLWTEPGLLRRPRRWPGLLAALLLPLLLYAYIPLRGRVTTSLDGRYENTWAGFWRWVTASEYGAFLSGNPFAVQRDAAFYFGLFRAQFGWTGLVLGLLGLIVLLRQPKRWALVVLAFVTNLVFALAYRAADVEVFFIPAFLLWSLLIAAGLGGLLDYVSRFTHHASRITHHVLRIACCVLLIALCLLEPLAMASANFPALDRSRDWAVHDYGRDMLAQPLPEGATVVGLLGEMTLVRYFQRVEGLRPDVVTVAADAEEARHAAIAAALAAGKAVYITRPLAGAPELYSLAAVGPLVRVWPKGEAQLPPPQHLSALPFTEAVELAGYSVETRRTHAGPVVRLTLHWRVTAPVGDDLSGLSPSGRSLKVSARLLDGAGEVVVATDDVPVHNTYPTWAWQPGEMVADGYDLPLPPGAGPGPYRLLVILYRAADGSEVGRGELGMVDAVAALGGGTARAQRSC